MPYPVVLPATTISSIELGLLYQINKSDVFLNILYFKYTMEID